MNVLKGQDGREPEAVEDTATRWLLRVLAIVDGVFQKCAISDVNVHLFPLMSNTTIQQVQGELHNMYNQ